jgi:hypothetical protein
VTVLRVPRADWRAGWRPSRPALEDHLYLVDPMGEWMMRMPVRTDPAAQARPRPPAARLVLVGPPGR